MILNRVKRYITFIAAMMLLLSQTPVFSQSSELNILAKWMKGSYSSHEQHLKDTANYYDISIEIIPVWKVRTDGYWFYVEQAMAGLTDKPYRQRVYHLRQSGPGLYESVVYLLPDPLRFALHPELVESLHIDSLTEKKGCSVILKKSGKKHFTGGTSGKNCPSDRRGAVYATSEVNISRNMLLSWDRGFDEKDQQVWGATAGGYRFVKK